MAISTTNRTPEEVLSIAEGNVQTVSKDVGKLPGGTGGWGAESRYQAAHGDLYDARIAAGYQLSKRNRQGTYYILSTP
jgi:hypothetical protein